jgi:hypothetical protein
MPLVADYLPEREMLPVRVPQYTLFVVLRQARVGVDG